jgi:hypothetical protein
MRRQGEAHGAEDEERAFLELFITKAEAGELVTTRAIRQACEEWVGRSVYSSTIYGLLHRHNCHRITPHSQYCKLQRYLFAHVSGGIFSRCPITYAVVGWAE